MTKVQTIINEVRKNGEWCGKLSYVDINYIHSKGLYCLAIEGGKYKVQDWDNTLKQI